MDSKYTAGTIVRFEFPTITEPYTARNGETWDRTLNDEESVEYQEMLTFYKSNVTSRYCVHYNNNAVMPAHVLVHCTDTNMDNATVINTLEVLEASNSWNDRHGRSFQIVDAWVIVAEDGKRVVMNNSPIVYTTEAAARKAFTKFKATARKEIEAEARKAAAAEAAKRACTKRVTDADVKTTDIEIGDLVPVRAMGKARVGVVVGATAAKWIVAFTTPSNPDEIRETRIDRSRN